MKPLPITGAPASDLASPGSISSGATSSNTTSASTNLKKAVPNTADGGASDGTTEAPTGDSSYSTSGEPTLAGEVASAGGSGIKGSDGLDSPLPAASPQATGNLPTSWLPEQESNQIFLDELSSTAPRLPLPASIHSAEGYLELVTQAALRLGVHRDVRRKFAMKSLELATEAGPQAISEYEARRQMVIGQSRRLLKRYSAAINSFRLASKHRPTRVKALMATGWCQKRLGRADLAVVTLTRALSIVPEDARLHYNLACYLSLSGQYRAAVYELAWALELKPSLRARAKYEGDLEALHGSPAFESLTAS